MRKAVRELDITLPFANEQVRKSLVDYCAEHIPNVELRQGFHEAVADMAERLADPGIQEGQ